MRSVIGFLAVAMVMAGADAVVDFEGVTVLLAPNDKANRAEKWEEKGLVFKLAREPKSTKAKGLVMFFEHLTSGHKGIGSAMALEPIPVQVNFHKAVSEVTMAFWGSAGAPAVLEAFDEAGKLVDRAEVAAVPGRKGPGDAVPVFELTVKGPRIAYVQFSGPRAGEYLAADEVRFRLAGE